MPLLRILSLLLTFVGFTKMSPGSVLSCSSTTLLPNWTRFTSLRMVCICPFHAWNLLPLLPICTKHIHLPDFSPNITFSSNTTLTPSHPSLLCVPASSFPWWFYFQGISLALCNYLFIVYLHERTIDMLKVVARCILLTVHPPCLF